MASYAPGRQRTTLCIFYEKGWCTSGNDCRFTHGTSDKRKLLGDGVEGALGKPATIREPCKFFAKGNCSKGNMCPFSHSSYSADEVHRRETLADNRPFKRPTPAALASPCYQPVGAARLTKEANGAVAVAEQPPLIRRGMLMVTKQDLLPLDGGDTDTGDSDLEDEPWEDPGSNEGSAYFFGAPGRFDAGSGGGGDGGVSSAMSGKGHGSWRDIVQGSSEACEDPTVANDGKPLQIVDATIRALVSSAAADAGVDVEAKPSRDKARAARAAAAFSALNSALSSPRAGKRKVCAFFVRGCCRFGEYCRNSHELDQPEPVEVTKEVNGQGHEGEEAAVVEAVAEAGGAKEERDLGKDTAAKGAALEETEKAQSQVADCGVCLERIRDRFGILVGCRHSYCLKCIREWRGKSQKRNCPECGVPSHFVVPSHTLVTDPVRKELLVSRYKESLSTIPCQHFEYGVSECPFGSSCFYAHLKKDGSLDLPATPRIRWSAAGDSEAMREVHLSSFFDPRL